MKCVTCCNEKRMGYEQLKHSAAVNGFDLVTVVDPDSWVGLISKLRILWRTIAKWPDDEVILYLDAFDTVITAQQSLVRYRYDNHIAGKVGKLLISGETNCAPDQEIKSQYHHTESPYPYVNAGAMIGPVCTFKHMLAHIKPWMLPDDINDQAALHSYYLRNPGVSIVDDRASIMMSMYHAEDHIRPFSKGAFTNTITGTNPVIFHGNGRSDLSMIFANIDCDRSDPAPVSISGDM